MTMVNMDYIAKLNKKKKGRERHKPHHFQNRSGRIHSCAGNPGSGLCRAEIAEPKEKSTFSCPL